MTGWGRNRTLAPAATLAALVALALATSSGASLAKPDHQASGYPWKSRVASAREFAKHRTGSVSFAIVGEHGNLRGNATRRRFHSASVVKAMLLVSYLRRPSVRHRDLDSSDKALLAPMILRSDNATATAVYNIVGNHGLRKLAHAAHMHDFRPQVVWGLTEITAADMAPFMFHLRRFIPSRHRHYAFHLLSHIVSYQRWGVPPAKPPGWRVFFKGGFIPAGGGWRINQVALLRRGDRRLGLAVLSQGNPTLEYGAKTVQGVTARLLRNYNEFKHRPARVGQARDQARS